MDETHLGVAGGWMYLFRAVDTRGDTVGFYPSETRDRDAARCFLQAALANSITGRAASSLSTKTAAIEQPSAN